MKFEDLFKIMSFEELKENVVASYGKYCVYVDPDDSHVLKPWIENFPFLATHNNCEFFELACDTGNLELLKLFVKHGADPNCSTYPFYVCDHKKYNDCLEYLEGFVKKN